MRILFLSQVYPYPINNGARRRTEAFLGNLSVHHEITFAGITVLQDTIQQKTGFLRWKETVFPRLENKFTAFIKSLFSHRFYQEVKFWNPELEFAIEQLLVGEEYDIIWLNFPSMCRYLEHWYETVQKKPLLVLDQHNLDEKIWENQITVNHNIFHRYYSKQQLRKVITFQKKWFPRFNFILSVSPEDLVGTRQYINEINTKVMLAPNGVDVNYFLPQRKEIDVRGAPIMVFGAAMDVIMNQDAAHWFIEKVLPLIEAQIEGVQFWIVGRQPPAFIRRYATSGRIIITGTVDSVQEYYRKADVFVVPLRMG